MAADFIPETDMTDDELIEAESGAFVRDGRELKAWSVDRTGTQWYRATDLPEVRGTPRGEIQAVLSDDEENEIEGDDFVD